ncbi:hypothetical protein CAPTEDRAFT_174895 [Capitella teleta]|uniref:HIG1 domain-containing protein n=1 Tax=Capitella teleta TaxID=283909 RepID=R7TVT3_CAPTE|nr:hypothetical protein CAPTEDRAFT_174895 [Capitella teleta]|eukprot:ELT95581.1 hypothetical protein CAPTEDRAFT_174895 [Capitella teleta]
MTDQRPNIDDEVVHKKTFMDKCLDQPFVPLGILGTLGMLGYGAVNFKNRGSMSTSVYLMHLRVKAQSMVVGAMALGVSYALLKDHFTGHYSKELDSKPQ